MLIPDLICVPVVNDRVDEGEDRSAIRILHDHSAQSDNHSEEEDINEC